MSDFEKFRRLLKAVIGYKYHGAATKISETMFKMLPNKEFWHVNSSYHTVLMTGYLYMMGLLSEAPEEYTEKAFELYKASLNIWRKTVA